VKDKDQRGGKPPQLVYARVVGDVERFHGGNYTGAVRNACLAISFAFPPTTTRLGSIN
jgi:hypothetical protein